MNCSYCGTWHPPHGDTRFCTTCGTPFVTAVAPTDATTSLRHQDTQAVPMAPVPPPARSDWKRHPATWSIAAAVIVVVGLVVAAIIVTSGDGTSAPQAGGGPSAGSPTAASTSLPPATVTAAPPRNSTVTVVPPQTRTVTRVVVPEYGSGPSVNGSFSSEFASSRQVDASTYSSGGTVYFSSPSGNIGCRIVGYGSRVECTITDYLFSEPGYDCDDGAGVLMYEASSPSIDCVGYTYSGDRALPYGYSVVNGDMACVSRSDGITCADMTTGDAFRLSRESYDSTS